MTTRAVITECEIGRCTRGEFRVHEYELLLCVEKCIANLKKKKK